MLPPFAALRAFDAVARVGGVRRAAQELDLDHAVVSRHIRKLEAWLGLALVDRARGGTRLTREGEHYHRRISEAIDGIAEATMDLRRHGDENRLHIWCVPGFAFQWLAGRLTEFQRANPAFDIELRPTDAGPDFGQQQADIDIRYMAIYSAPPAYHSSVRMLEIARPPVIPVASPAYLASHPPIRVVGDIPAHHLIHEESVDNWRTWLAHHDVPVEGATLSGPRLWHAHLTIDTARRGLGIALANHFLAADDLAAGRLIEISGDHQPFSHIALGSYVFAARADRWNGRAVARCRKWLTKLIDAELGGRELERSPIGGTPLDLVLRT